MKQNAGPHPAESAAVQIKRTRNEMMLLDISPILFLTHVGNLTTVKNNQRRFAPTPAHITGIKCPHHRNKQSVLDVTRRLVSVWIEAQLRKPVAVRFAFAKLVLGAAKCAAARRGIRRNRWLAIA
jgi:hypothetical protein